jgi:hypothetical protein
MDDRGCSASPPSLLEEQVGLAPACAAIGLPAQKPLTRKRLVMLSFVLIRWIACPRSGAMVNTLSGRPRGSTGNLRGA